MSRAGAPKPSPLLFRPILKEKVWGGARLRALLGKTAPTDEKIGESWEIADLASTDPGGGGGGAQRSVIDRGPLEGKTIHDALELWGADLVGDAAPAADDGFPLLVKFLDADQRLSVQTHPSPEHAATHTDAHLKTESWFVLHAEPGAVIYKGLKRAVARSQLREAALDGSIVELLRAVPARVGDCHNLPSGVVHALGAGVTVAEVQTPSDTTFRLYDWGRTGRTLHIDQAVQCAILEADESAPARHDSPGRATLVEERAFTIDHVRLGPGQSCAAASERRCAVWIVVEGAGQLRAGDFQAELRAGSTALIPAASAAEARLVAGSNGVCALEATPAPPQREGGRHGP